MGLRFEFILAGVGEEGGERVSAVVTTVVVCSGGGFAVCVDFLKFQRQKQV